MTRIDFPKVDPVVSVVLLAMKNPALLMESLLSLHAHASAGPAFEVVIVLNAATHEVRECVEGSVTGAVVVDSPVNLGTGGGFNRGFAASSAPYLAITHDDAQVTPGWLSPLLAAMQGDPLLGAVGGRIDGLDGRVQAMGGVIFRDGTSHPEWMGDHPSPDLVNRPRAVDYHGGLGLLVRREAWEAVGGFDDVSYYPAYYADADFCFRLRAGGWGVRYEPRSVLVHHRGQSTTPPFRQFIAGRNRDAFARMHRDVLERHGEFAPGDSAAVAAEIERAASPTTGSRSAGASPAARAQLDERLSRPEEAYACMERDVWREFATEQTAALIAARSSLAAAEAARRGWQQVARATGEDRDRWRARAADVSAQADVVAGALGRTSDALDQVTSSRWWRFRQRLRGR